MPFFSQSSAGGGSVGVSRGGQGVVYDAVVRYAIGMQVPVARFKLVCKKVKAIIV